MLNAATVTLAILQLLQQDAALRLILPDGVWFAEAPPGSTRFGIVQLISAVDVPMFGGPAYKDTVYLVEARALMTTGADVESAFARIKVLLTDADLTIPDYGAMLSQFEEEIETVEVDDIDPSIRWNRCGGHVRVMVAPLVVVPPPPTSSYPTLVVDDGAIHYWRLNEAAGTVAADGVGGAPGAITGGVTFGQPGPLADGSPALTFDGTTGVIQVGTITLPRIATLECWFYPAASAPSRPFLTWGTAQSPTAYSTTVGAKRVAQYYDPVGSASASGAIALTPAVWHHVVYVLNGTTVVEYVDGVVDVQAPAPRAAATVDTLQIGGDPAFPIADPRRFLEGGLAEVAIYPVALTAQQIANHYAAAAIVT